MDSAHDRLGSPLGGRVGLGRQRVLRPVTVAGSSNGARGGQDVGGDARGRGRLRRGVDRRNRRASWQTLQVDHRTDVFLRRCAARCSAVEVSYVARPTKSQSFTWHIGQCKPSLRETLHGGARFDQYGRIGGCHFRTTGTFGGRRAGPGPGRNRRAICLAPSTLRAPLPARAGAAQSRISVCGSGPFGGPRPDRLMAEQKQFEARLPLFELGPYPGDGGDVIVVEGIDEIFLH